MEINLKNNIDHLYSLEKDANYLSRSEKKCLKSILLTHLDLIQEQNLQLIAKDNIIKALKYENEELKQRIQRLLKRSKQSAKEYFSELEHAKSKIKKTVIHPFQNQSQNNNNNNNNQEVSFGSKKGKPAIHKSGISKAENNSKATNEKSRNETIDTSEDEKKMSEDNKHQSISIKLSSKNLFLNTAEEYTINAWKTLEIDYEELQKDFSEEVDLETPRWVEKPLPELDGSMKHTDTFIEDISDEVYQKRHQKLEIDERRRKKWDVQRIREQKNIERLKKRHLKEEYASEYGNDKQAKTITSLFPDVESIRYIQITDLLPVHAFGELIPKLQPKDFSYPGNNNVYSVGNQGVAMDDNPAPTIHLRTKFVYANNSFARRTNEQKSKK